MTSVGIGVSGATNQDSPIRAPTLFTAFTTALLAAVLALPGPLSIARAVLTVFGWAVLVLIVRPGRGIVGTSLLAVSFALLLKADVSGLPPEALAVGTIGVLVALSPFVVRPLKRYEGYPFLHLFGLISAAYLTVGFLLGQSPAGLLRLTLPGNLTASQRLSGLVWFLIFLLCVVLGGLAIRQSVPRRTAEEEELAWTVAMPRALLLVAVGFALSATIGLAAANSLSLGAIPTFVDQLRYVGLLAVWLGWLRGRVSTFLLWAAVAVVGITVVAGFGTGSLYAGLSVPIGALCLYVAERRRVPWFTVTVVLMVALSLNVAKTTFRIDYGGTDNQSGTHLSNSVQFLGIYGSTLTNLSRPEVQVSANRFSEAAGDMLGYTVTNVPTNYPYWNKSTYLLLPLSVVPRALYPSKPVADFGNEFGRQYGVIAPDDYATSANVPLSVEAYVNFGKVGLVVGGLLFGIGLGLLGRLFRRRTAGKMILASLVAITILGGVESDSSITFGVLPGILLVGVPCVWWLTHQRERTP